MKLNFVQLTEPTPEIIAAINRWHNDPDLRHFIRPNQNQADLEREELVTVEEMIRRLEHVHTYLLYLDEQLIGEMNYMVDPGHLYKKEPRTAWIGITIGESVGRDKGVGALAMQYLAEQIRAKGLKRIELGVFEFNTRAIRLYQKLGYQEIGRINDFTYWQGKLWQDIRMEKRIEVGLHTPLPETDLPITLL